MIWLFGQRSALLRKLVGNLEHVQTDHKDMGVREEEALRGN